MERLIFKGGIFMKHKIFFTLTLALTGILLGNSMSTFAIESNLKLDSIELSDEEKETLGVVELYSDVNTKPELRVNDNISSAIRLYNVSFLSAFTKYSTIDEVFSNDCVNETYFVIKYADDTFAYFNDNYEKLKSNRYIVIDDKKIELPPIEVSAKALAALNNSDLLKDNIAEDVETYNIYFLSDEINRMGSALYYKTNHGDYIYYYHYDTGELLFTVDEFVDFENSVLEKLKENSDKDGAISLNDVTDLSKYKLINSNNQNEFVNINYGDLNDDGTADLTDLTLLSLYLMKSADFTDSQIEAADIDGSGDVDIADLAYFKQYICKDQSVMSKLRIGKF